MTGQLGPDSATPASANQSRGPDQLSGFRLSRRARRLVLLTHLMLALGWLGADVVVGVLAVTGFVSDDPAQVAASYTALNTFAVPVLLIFGLGTLGSGVVLSLASRLGLIRHWWVLIKLLLNLGLSALVLILLQPRLTTAAEQATRIDQTLTDRLGTIPVDLLFPAFVSGAALIGAALLGTFRPWGPTPFAQRSKPNPRRS